MKKFISFIIALAIFATLLPGTNVFASTAADKISIFPYSDTLSFSKMQMGKVNCGIYNDGNPIGARVEIYMDGHLQPNAGSDYFVIYKHNDENFDVYIPPILDAGVYHTLTLKFILDDGSYKSVSVPFTVNPNPVGITAEIVSHPISVEPGVELYFAVKLNFSDKRYGYRVRTSVDINSSHVSAFDELRTVGDGEVIWITVPGYYTSAPGEKFRFEFNVNSFPGYGETSAYAGVWVPVQGYEKAPASNDLIKPVKIPASFNKDGRAYTSYSLTGNYITIPAGTVVTYMNPDSSKSMSKAKIQTADGSIYWTAMSNIYISTENYVIPDNLTIEQKEAFVNNGLYSSKTDYLIWINLERQILTLFMGHTGGWKYVNTFPVASGKNYTPTPTVVHEITGKTVWVTSTYTCSPVMLLYDGYAIHNQPVSPSGYVTDKTIGKPASAGCVRMLQKDIDYVNYYCPVGTNVVIY